jgi:vacuolar-type H+-ATPase subunit H
VGQVSELLPEPSPAQQILKRLIEAEDQARIAVEAAEESARAAIAEAQRQATETLDAVRQAAAGVLRSRLEEAEAQGAAETKQRLEEAEMQGREFELRAAAHFSGAVELVVDWVAGGGD